METLGGREILSFMISNSDFVRNELENLKENKQDSLIDLLFRKDKDEVKEKKKNNINDSLYLINEYNNFHINLHISNPIQLCLKFEEPDIETIIFLVQHMFNQEKNTIHH